MKSQIKHNMIYKWTKLKISIQKIQTYIPLSTLMFILCKENLVYLNVVYKCFLNV